MIKKVLIKQDIPLRAHTSGTWVESGIYEVIREFQDDRYIIKLGAYNTLITIIDKNECELLS